MVLIVSNSSVPLSPLLAISDNHRLRSCVLVRSVGDDASVIVSPKSVRIDGGSSYDVRGKKKVKNVHIELEPLLDDGYGSQTVKDFIAVAHDLFKIDEGPPRWFCPVACGKPLKESPVLLYLPGIDGTGACLVVHEKALGKVFHVQCLHIPVWDRTPLEGLIKLVEETVMIEKTLSPNKPIYLLGDSFGGALALAVAAHNPTIDLILILANPGTSYERSPLHLIDAVVKALPDEYYGITPFVLSHVLGDYVKMEAVGMDGPNHSPSTMHLFCSLVEDAPLLSRLAKVFPNETFDWRLKLAKSAAAYANSRLHAVTAQVLVLASGKDMLIPSKSEARRLSRLLKQCKIRIFEENGHAILLESGVNVLSTIKANQMYRHSLKHDFFYDFLPPSLTELKRSTMETWRYRLSMGAAMFSTMEDGKIVSGISGIPNEGPVLLVGNNTLCGFEAFPFFSEYLREKKTVLHVLTHPETFSIYVEDEYLMIPYTDIMKLYGAIPVSARNIFKYLSRKSYTLAFPGGSQGSFYPKVEPTGNLFWPDKQDFVRMAVKFGATIIPFGVVGEDISELIFDYEEMKQIPFLNQMVNEFSQGKTYVRKGGRGEIVKQLHFPIHLPKLPGRLYYMLYDIENMLYDIDYLREVYLQIRCDVENNMAYLLKKREEDPYRGLVETLMWCMAYGSLDDIPSFEP